MRLIIDVPEKAYTIRKENPVWYDSNMDKAIANGIPLKDIELVDKKILINKLRTDFDYDDVYMPRHFEDIVDDAFELTKEFDFKEK